MHSVSKLTHTVKSDSCANVFMYWFAYTYPVYISIACMDPAMHTFAWTFVQILCIATLAGTLMHLHGYCILVATHCAIGMSVFVGLRAVRDVWTDYVKG